MPVARLDATGQRYHNRIDFATEMPPETLARIAVFCGMGFQPMVHVLMHIMRTFQYRCCFKGKQNGLPRRTAAHGLEAQCDEIQSRKPGGNLDACLRAFHNSPEPTEAILPQRRGDAE
jgi:hypothetical protein